MVGVVEVEAGVVQKEEEGADYEGVAIGKRLNFE